MATEYANTTELRPEFSQIKLHFLLSYILLSQSVRCVISLCFTLNMTLAQASRWNKTSIRIFFNVQWDGALSSTLVDRPGLYRFTMPPILYWQNDCQLIFNEWDRSPGDANTSAKRLEPPVSIWATRPVRLTWFSYDIQFHFERAPQTDKLVQSDQLRIAYALAFFDHEMCKIGVSTFLAIRKPDNRYEVEWIEL